MGLILSVLLIILSSYFLWKICFNFDRYSKIIGYRLTDGVRGATINAIGSSLPELFTSLFFLFILKDVIGFSAGIATILGSAVFNILVIPSIIIPILIKNNHEIIIRKKIIMRDAGVLLISQLSLLYFIKDGVISLSDAFYLFLIYLSYILLLTRGAVLADKSPSKHKKRTQNALKYLLWDICKISFWCLILVKSCELMGGGPFPTYIPYSEYLSGMGWDIMIIAVFVAAAASSIPDLFISVVDAKNGNVDDSIANPLASNLFDICISFGLPLFIYTLTEGEINLNQSSSISSLADINALIVIMIGLTLLFILSVLVVKKYRLAHSFLFIILYFVFIYLIFNLHLIP